MNATILSNNEKHYPVLLNEILSIISPQNGGTFIDCTFGQGGYSKEILKFSNTKVIAFDRDSKCKEIADSFKKKNKDRFTFFNKKFSEIKDLESDFKNIKAVIFDLGFSYSQIKDPEKGLSFDNKGPLNMRMGKNNFSAEDVINKLDQKDLELIFKYFGEDKDFKKISKNIIRERENKLIDTPELVKIINYSKKNRNKKINNATKIFQAIRIFVNNEITELIYGLISALKVLKKDGVLAVVTFHSLEDKIVKYFFRSLSEKKSVSRYLPKMDQPEPLLEMIEKKPLTPSPKELKENISSRSAKLRYVVKRKNFYDFETDILKKFAYLIEIENFGKKL